MLSGIGAICVQSFKFLVVYLLELLLSFFSCFNQLLDIFLSLLDPTLKLLLLKHLHFIGPTWLVLNVPL